MNNQQSSLKKRRIRQTIRKLNPYRRRRMCRGCCREVIEIDDPKYKIYCFSCWLVKSLASDE
jgi:hypothetical protein